MVYEDGSPAQATVQLEARSPDAIRIWGQLDRHNTLDARLIERLRFSVSTEADGTFEARGLPAFSWNVQALSVPRGFLAREVPSVTARPGASVSARDIVLARGAVIRIRAVDAETGRVLRGHLPISYASQTTFNGTKALAPARRGEDGVLYLTAPAGAIDISMRLGHTGRRMNWSMNASAVSERTTRTYELGTDIEVSLDGGPRQKKRDGRLSIPIAKAQTRELTFFLRRADG